MVYYQKMTPEGYQEIKDEIARLKKDRPRRIKILQEARSMETCQKIQNIRLLRWN